MARSLGADALGFVLAPSKRRADPRVLRDLRDMDILKIAVVVTEKPAGRRRLGSGGARAARRGTRGRGAAAR